MRTVKVFLISFVLLFLIVGAVSASDVSEVTLQADNSVDKVSVIEDTITEEISSTNDIREIYVNDTGDDSNTGSINSPYSSIGKAISDVDSSMNTTIYLSKGTFGKDNDTNFQFTNKLNTYFDNSNVTFIGAGADKTFIDGQSAYKFMTITRQTPNLIFKDITFVNFRSSGPSVFALTRAGNLTIDNCIFKDCYSTNNGGTITTSASGRYLNGDLTVINSQFINAFGGAISSTAGNNPYKLYLENNTFINISNSRNDGVAVTGSKVYIVIKNNEFINVTCMNQNQAALHLTPPQESNTVITDNIFTNCECLNEWFMCPVYLSAYNADITFERNIFSNSTGAIGYEVSLSSGRMSNIKMNISNDIYVGNYEVNNGLIIPLNVTDDMGNSIYIGNGLTVNFVGENYTYNPGFSLKEKKLSFYTVPENGIYNITISYNDGLSTTDALATVNVNLSNDPVDIWVSPEGSDAGNGSSDRPFKTIQHAIDVGFEKSFNVIVHLIEGTYLGEDNVNLTVANKGSLKIIGEKYNRTVIDGEHSSWFMHVSTCEVEVENLNFINGAGTGHIISGQSLNLKDCIVDSCVAARNQYVLYRPLFDNLIYINNIGTIYYSSQKNITKSYFANNKNIYDTNGIIYGYFYSFTISDCKFINNSATNSNGVYSGSVSGSINNYYYGNSALNNGVFNSGTTLINDTYVNNRAEKSYGIGDLSKATVINCTFINNTAGETAGLGIITLSSSFDNCSFINNSAINGGVFIIEAVSHEKGTDYEEIISFDKVTFESNHADKGNDIYLKPRLPNSYYDYTYPIALTVNFNNVSVSSLVDNLTATVLGPNGIIVGGPDVEFYYNNIYIGSSELINGNATLEYAGFTKGKATVTGNIIYPSVKNIINDVTLDIKLDGVLDHIDYWVSNSGSDLNGDGSESNPFKTIQFAVDKAFENCRDITIYLGEETYFGGNNTNLTLSSVSNITIIGKGIGKTVIDGKNSSYFANVLNGNNKVVISDLTIINMTPDYKAELPIGSTSPSGIHSIIKAGSISPITVEKGANLYLTNVNITECHGGVAIIDGSGNVFIENSVLYKNGVATGIIKCENLLINNSVINRHLIGGYPIRATNIVIKNTEIIDAFNIIRNGFYFIQGATNTTIENTNILINNWENPLNILDITDMYDSQICPISCINSENTFVLNSTFKNEFELVYLWQSTTDYSYNNIFSGQNLTVLNSSFEGYRYIIMSRSTSITNQPRYTIDGCSFNNVTNLMFSMSRNIVLSVSNSVLLDINNHITSNDALNNTFIFNNNYWGNNSEPIIPNSVASFTLSSPDTWIILTSEGEEPIFKLTDGENVTSYNGALPAKISYVADENGEIIPVVNIAGTGYKFSVDENGSVVLNNSAPMKNIVPKVAVNETVFADDVTVVLNDGSRFTARFTNKWGDPLKNTQVSFVIGDNVINATTDVNGSAGFAINFALGKYAVSISNPVTGQNVFNTISVIVEDSIFANDVASVFNDGSKFVANFTDKFGNVLANTNVTFMVGNDTINAVTDENGTASFIIAFNAGNYTVSAINPVTGQTVNKKIIVNESETKLKASSLIMYYNTGKYFIVTLKDANGNVLANQTVSIKINGRTFKKVTNAKGQANLRITLPVKNYYLTTVTFAGNDNYLKSTVKAKVIVKKVAPKLFALKKTYKVRAKVKYYSVILKTNKNQYMKKSLVTLKVNGKLYKAYTNAKGKAIFKITNLNKVGRFNALVKFAGNKNFRLLGKFVRITVVR